MNIKDLLEQSIKTPNKKNNHQTDVEAQTNITQTDKPNLDLALAKFAKIMQWQEEQNTQSWTENLLSHLVPFVKGIQASLYYVSKKALVYGGGFALDFEENIKKTYRFGEGIIGEVGKSQELLILKDNKDFASITSTKQIRLKCIIFLPLVYNLKTIGVIEINFPQNPNKYYLDFLKFISESIAASLNALVKEEALAQSLRKIRQSEERLQRLAEVTTEGIAFLNNNREIVECNSAFSKIFGYSAEMLKGKTLSQLLHNEDQDTTQLEEKISSDIPVETIGERQNGSTLDIEIQERDIVYNNAFYHIISVRDISQRKEAEKNLKDTETQLEEAQKVIELTEIIKKKNKNITASINYAKRIQEAILPDIAEFQEVFPNIFVFFRPKDIVSGDFYWFTEINGKFIIAAVDCTGHGVPGAIMSMAGSLFLKQIVNMQGITSPDEILTQLHVNIQKSLKQRETGNRDGMDAAVCTIDPESETMEFAGAKNSIVRINKGTLTEISGDSMPIGGLWNKKEQNRIFRKESLSYEKGDSFYMFTDGYEDQFGGDEGRKFMKKRLKKLFTEICHKDLKEQKSIIDKKIKTWMLEGEDTQNQIDDMLVIGFKL